MKDNRDWFVGPPVSCAVCDKCHWDLRSGTPPTRCLYNGPYAGYVEAKPSDADGNHRLYWVDPRFKGA